MYIKLQSKLVVLTRPGPRITLSKDTTVIVSLLVAKPVELRRILPSTAQNTLEFNPEQGCKCMFSVSV
jgi:hypothetical protein